MKSFEFNTIKKYPVICLIGKRRSGKSYMIRDLLYNHFHKQRKYKNIMLISPTSNMNTDYDLIPNKNKFENFSSDLLEGLMERQKKLIKDDPKGKYDTCIVLDDVVNMSDKNEARILSGLLVKSRHYRISVILSLQYLKSREFPPASRDNIDYAVIFKQHNKENVKNIVEQWLGGDPQIEELGYRMTTKIPDVSSHRVLIIDSSEFGENIKEFTYQYIADKIPKKFTF